MNQDFSTTFRHFGDLQSHTTASPPLAGDCAAAAAHDSNLLPIANVGRVMRAALPPHAKVSKRAKETVQECAAEFIGFVTGEASERCRRERRKTVTGDDICRAMDALGLDPYAEAMRRYLRRFRESEELAASLNHKEGIQYQIDLRDQLSIFRGERPRPG